MKLHVKLISATNLKAADIGGTSDPYVKFVIGKREEKCSRVIQSTINPVWDENLELTVMDPGREVVEMTVFDKDRLNKDDAIGTAKFSLQNCKNGAPVEWVFVLHDIEQGELRVQFIAEGFGGH